MTNIANFKLLQKKAPQTPRILAIPKKIIKVFLHLLTKPTKKSYKEGPPNRPVNTVNPIKQNLLDKEPDLLGNLNPPNHVKNRLPRWGGIQQQTKNEFTRIDEKLPKYKVK